MSNMTPESIRRALAYIESTRADDEAAHGAEDALHKAVLLAIADGTASDPAACARETLRTIEIEFARWCA